MTGPEFRRVQMQTERRGILGHAGIHREFVRGYVHDATADLAFHESLKRLAEFCYNLHAAMRWELCEGW